MVAPFDPHFGQTITVFLPPTEPTTMAIAISTRPGTTPNGSAKIPQTKRTIPRHPPALANSLTCAGTKATLHVGHAATVGDGGGAGVFQGLLDRSAEQKRHRIASALIISAQ